MQPEEGSTIRLSNEMKEKLKRIGKMGDSFEDVIKFLVAYYEEKEGEKEE